MNYSCNKRKQKKIIAKWKFSLSAVDSFNIVSRCAITKRMIFQTRRKNKNKYLSPSKRF